MKRRLEVFGYQIVWWLALRESRPARWLHNAWSSLWYRHYCPYPIQHDLTARACIKAGHCGCDNQLAH